MKDHLMRGLEALFALMESRKKRKNLPLVIEGLEDRVTPAFDMTIGAGANAGVNVQRVGNVTTVTANATGALVSVNFLAAEFAAGNDVIIDNGSGTATPAEVGAIVWTAPLALGAIPSSGLGRTLTIRQDPTTTTGSISLGTGLTAFITGNQQNNINLIVNAHGGPNYLGGPKIDIHGDANTGINNITLDTIVTVGGVSTGVGHVAVDSLFTALGNISIDSNLVVVGDGIGTDGFSSANGNIFINTLNGTGQVVFNNADNELSAPLGSISVTGNMAVDSAGNNLTLVSNSSVTVSGTFGDPSGNQTFGTVTINSAGPVGAPSSINFNGPVGLDGFVSISPTGNTYNLNLLGGGYFNGILGNPTTFDTLGVITIGNGTQDIFTFESGVSLAVASPQVGGAPFVNAIIRTPGEIIELLDAALVNAVVLDTTNNGLVPAGGNITIDDMLAHAVTTTGLSTLSLNGGSSGDVKINAPLSGSVAVTIQNSGTTEFNAPVNLTGLSINNTTSTVTFQAPGSAATALLPAVSGMVLGSLTMQSGRNFQVVFANPSIATNIPAYSITGSPVGSETLRFVGPGPVTIQPTSSGANFTGRVSVEGGVLTVNGNYSTINFDLKGGTTGGTGSVNSLNSIAPISSVIAPGGSGTVGTFTASTLNLNDSSTLSVDLAMGSGDRLITNNQPILNGARLTGTVTFSSMKTGTTYTILTNNSNQPVLGIFAGLPQGGTTQIGNQIFSINYLAGDGNDISLTAVTGSNTPIGNTPNERYVSYLFLTIMGRQATSNELSLYSSRLDQGASRNSVAASIYNSVEQQNNQVQGYFQQFLKRNGNSSEISRFVNSLRAGASANSVISTFILSREYQAAFSVRQFIPQFVRSLYINLLGRNPDAAGFATNCNALRTGVTREALVLSFLNSTEYISRQVRIQYQSQLGFSPNQSSLNFWVNQMRANGIGSLVVGLAASNSAFQRAQGNSV